jgi:hypothetical protein
LLITLSRWVLALLARFTDDDYLLAVMGDGQWVVAVAWCVAVFAAVVLVAHRLPADLPLSWLRHDGDRGADASSRVTVGR